jgi:glycosyltransferase
MNLYLFNDNENASIYGIGTYIKTLTGTLENTSINVHIVHLRSIRSEFEIEKIDRVEYWYIPEVQNENTFSGPIAKVEGYFQNVIYLLRLYIKDTNELVFHFNYNTYQLLAKELKTVFNCKTVNTVHYVKWMLELNSNLSMLHTFKSKPQDLMSKYEKSLVKTDEYENLLYKEVDKVIVLCQYMQNLLQSEYGIDRDKIVVIPNGLADCGLNDTMTIRKKWRISDDELLILFAGRLNVVKGLDYLIKAFHKVLQTIPNCRLMIAGNGDYDSYMKECEDIWMNVTWTGMLNKNKLYELYSVADIGVMPSLHEQCSYVAIEMMMHGVPLVASTSTGLREMVEDGITGLHVSVIEYPDRMGIDSDLLAEKMLLLLQNYTKRKQMGKNARERYERLYTSEVMRENMLDFYSSL